MADTSHDRRPSHPSHATNPFHNHRPWDPMMPDPEEGDISHVEWNPTPGIHFSRTSYRTTSPSRMRVGPPGQPGTHDPFAHIFQSFSTILGGPNEVEQNAFPSMMRIHPGSPQQSRNNQGLDSPHIRQRNGNNPQPNVFPVDNLQG